MTKVIQIFESTSLTDVQGWLDGSEKASDTRFLVTRDSGFAPGVEGVALGAIAEISQVGAITIEATIESVQELKLFDSLFGVSLCLLSSSVLTPKASSNIESLADTQWRRVVENGGVVGSGNRIGFVFRDPDYWLPRFFSGEEGEFPKRDSFRRGLERVVSRLGLQRTFSNTEDDALTFLYETAQNSHEHGRLGSDGRTVSGVRGIVLERISINSAKELERRRDLEGFQREYLHSQIKKWGTPLIFFSFTVADLGSGIQNTLPVLAENPDETPWQRLNRAFLAGATRKKQSAGLDAGQGLFKLQSSAERLQALLFVKSSRLSGYLDFSEPTQSQALRQISSSLCEVGTVLTLMWPAIPAGGDQGMLPLNFT